MKTISYDSMVKTLSKSGKDILESLTPIKCEMWHHASCIQGEAGELFDAVKKHIIYNKILEVKDRENVIEELGDLEFYMEGLRQACAITRQETLDYNATKLAKRYGEALQYNDRAAQIRADKQADPPPSREYKTLS